MIRHQLPAVLLVDGQETPLLRVSLAWYRGRPIEVDMRAERTVWPLAFDLLVDGLRFPSGLGDVFVCRVPDTALVEIVVDNGAVRAAVQVHADDLAGFVQAVQKAAQTSEAAQ